MRLRKPVLVEKPIALTLADADRILAALESTTGEAARRLQPALQGMLYFARRSRWPGPARHGRRRDGARVTIRAPRPSPILKRDPDATPVMDALTYYVDIMAGFSKDRPVEVVARGQHGIFKEAGYTCDDVTWAM